MAHLDYFAVCDGIEADLLEAPDAAHLELTVSAFTNLMRELEVDRPDFIHVGMPIAPLFGLPATIVSGPGRDWWIS